MAPFRSGSWAMAVSFTLAAATAWTVRAQATGDAPSKGPSPLKVVGNQVRNSREERVRLRGVNAASLEWTSDGEGHILETVRRAIEDWNANIVRLPLSQDRWFGKAPEQKDEGKAYRALVDRAVGLCAAKGSYVMLDLHWSNGGVWGKQIGQHKMPDRHSVAFWKDIAPRYRDNPAVLFDLYNEPHDVSWNLWQKGGTVTEKDVRKNTEITYEAVGMQELLDVVRATGARNVVVIGGLDWAYDLSGFLKGHRLADPGGNGLIYANHAYPFKGDSVEKWVAKMELATKTLPVIVSEFGSDPRRPGAKGIGGEDWVKAVMKALEDHQWDWTAWDLHPHAGPRLIVDWTYAPSPWFGRWVKDALAGSPPAATVPAPTSSNVAPGARP